MYVCNPPLTPPPPLQVQFPPLLEGLVWGGTSLLWPSLCYLLLTRLHVHHYAGGRGLVVSAIIIINITPLTCLSHVPHHHPLPPVCGVHVSRVWHVPRALLRPPRTLLVCCAVCAIVCSLTHYYATALLASHGGDDHQHFASLVRPCNTEG